MTLVIFQRNTLQSRDGNNEVIISTLKTGFTYRVATVFQFYRRQLGENFLVKTSQRSDKSAAMAIQKLMPTKDGLPYPLFVATAMEPTTVNGSYSISNKPFVFSPRFCGDFGNDANCMPSENVTLARFAARPEPLSLVDAVTLSGAAVSPLMTQNKCLSILVDFFNTGLGRRVYRTDVTASKQHTNRVRAFALLMAAVAFGAAAGLCTGDWVAGVIGLLFGLIVVVCLLFDIGSPSLLWALAFPREVKPKDASAAAKDAGSYYVADGGFADYLGVSELLRRRCTLIVVSDAGANVGDDRLGTLAQMCEKATSEMGVRFLDLDHEAPIDFGRLEIDERRLAHQPYLCMRIRYSNNGEADGRHDGLLFYCQMAITDNDPIEIQQIRNRFPSFPDEPTVNQFYTDEQVSAYRALGYHISTRLCRELERWKLDESDKTPGETASVPKCSATARGDGEDNHVTRFVNALKDVLSPPDCQTDHRRVKESPPLFDVLQERLLTAYRLACYEEIEYRQGEIFSEAVWPSRTFAYPSFRSHVRELIANTIDEPGLAVEQWLQAYERSADVRSAYRKAVLEDINALDVGKDCFTAALFTGLFDAVKKEESKAKAVEAAGEQPELSRKIILAAHLTTVAVACQEVHRGRPHAAFQIGGRNKLIELCGAIAHELDRSLTSFQGKEAAPDDATLRYYLDRSIAELTELETSIFQGGEHVTTISFAQCMTASWGRLARDSVKYPGKKEEAKDAPVVELKKRLEKVTDENSESRVMELRSKLEKGLRKRNLRLVMNMLMRVWYLGYYSRDEWNAAQPHGELTDDTEESNPGKKAPPNKRSAGNEEGKTDEDGNMDKDAAE